MTVKRVFKNTGVMFAGEIAARILEFIFIIYAARTLGVSGFGLLSSALAFTGLFSFLTDMGLYQLAIREIARDKDKGERYISEIAGLKAALNAATYAIMVLAAYALGYPSMFCLLIAVIGVSTIFESYNLLFNSLFQAHERLGYSAAARIIGALTLLSTGLAATRLGWGVLGLAFAYVLSRGATIAYCELTATRAFFRPAIRFNYHEWIPLLKESWPYGGTLVITNVFLSADIVLIAYFLGDAEAGIYSAASKLTLAMGFILAAHNQAFYPALARLHDKLDEFNKVSGAYLKSMILISAPMVLITWAASTTVIDILYPAEYSQAARILNLLIVSTAMGFLSSPYHRILDATGRQRIVFYAIIAGTLLNLTMNITLLKPYGTTAAAYAAMAGQLTFLLIPAAYCKRHGLNPKL